MTDAIDLTTVTILNSPDVRAWPVTAAISRLVCTLANTVFDFTKKDGADAWPAQPFGDPKDHGNCQYTVWLFLKLNAQWFAAGFIQCWQGRDGVGDGISDYVKNWYIAGRGWEPMVGHHIAVGEEIGFMVTAGNARLQGESSVHERSNIVTIRAPQNDDGVFTFQGDSPAPPVPVPDPAQPNDTLAFVAAVETLVSTLHETTAAILQLVAKVDAVQRAGVRVYL